jgi:hypothetical protein
VDLRRITTLLAALAAAASFGAAGAVLGPAHAKAEPAGAKTETACKARLHTLGGRKRLIERGSSRPSAGCPLRAAAPVPEFPR